MELFKEHFMDFMQQLYSKMEAGHGTYGDKSFNISNVKGVEEIQAELVDVCGWSLVQWIKLQRLKTYMFNMPVVGTEKVDITNSGKVSPPTTDEDELIVRRNSELPEDPSKLSTDELVVRHTQDSELISDLRLSPEANKMLNGRWPVPTGTTPDPSALRELRDNGYVFLDPTQCWDLTAKGRECRSDYVPPSKLSSDPRPQASLFPVLSEAAQVKLRHTGWPIEANPKTICPEITELHNLKFIESLPHRKEGEFPTNRWNLTIMGTSWMEHNK